MIEFLLHWYFPLPRDFVPNKNSQKFAWTSTGRRILFGHAKSSWASREGQIKDICWCDRRNGRNNNSCAQRIQIHIEYMRQNDTEQERKTK